MLKFFSNQSKYLILLFVCSRYKKAVCSSDYISLQMVTQLVNNKLQKCITKQSWPNFGYYLVYGSLQHLTRRPTSDLCTLIRLIKIYSLCSACVTVQKAETTANPWPKHTGWQEQTCQQSPQTMHQTVQCTGCHEKILADIFSDTEKHTKTY